MHKSSSTWHEHALIDRNNAWDSNLINANAKYISVNWDSIGGGAFGVIPITEYGKLPDQIPLFRGHKGPVLDTDWNPFDDDVVASGSDDGNIALWRVPKDYTLKFEDPEEIKDVAPFKILEGHQKKVGLVSFHPTAENVLASASADYTVKIWNIETGEVLFTLQHNDLVTSFTFNYDGSLIATTGRDKRIRVWDIRKEEVISEGPGHTGIKSSRIVWLGKENRLITTGFSKLSDRQFALWDSTDIPAGPIGGFKILDSSAGICMPFYDEDTTCLYLGGKGDGNIRYYEYSNDELYFLSEYQSSEPQRGLAVVPKKGLNIHDHEVVRFYKTVNDTTIQPISFIVPKKAQSFQGDIYPDTRASEPALTAEDWASGKTLPPKVISLKSIFDGQEATARDGDSYEPTPSPKKKEADKKPSVVDQIKPAPKADLKSVESKPTPKADLKGAEDTKDMFSTPGIQSFLKKAADEPEEEKTEAIPGEVSSWDIEEKPESAKASEPAKDIVKESSKESSEKSIKEPVNESVDDPVEKTAEKTREPKTDKDSIKNGSVEDKSTSSTNNSKTESLEKHLSKDIHSIVSNLQSHVHELGSKVEELVKKLEERDERIAKLEDKLFTATL